MLSTHPKSPHDRARAKSNQPKPDEFIQNPGQMLMRRLVALAPKQSASARPIKGNKAAKSRRARGREILAVESRNN